MCQVEKAAIPHSGNEKIYSIAVSDQLHEKAYAMGIDMTLQRRYTPKLTCKYKLVCHVHVNLTLALSCTRHSSNLGSQFGKRPAPSTTKRAFNCYATT